MSAWIVAGLAVSTWAGGKQMIKGLFNDSGTDLTYVGRTWSVRSEEGRGWVSLTVGESEFLACGKTYGAMVMKKGDQFITYFPCHANISHDDRVGRIGSVSDGINMIRISPDSKKPEAELYLGANETQEQAVCMFLNDRVKVSAASAREIVLAHENGITFTIRSGTNDGDLAVGKMKDPAGEERLTVTYPCKGFAANSYQWVFPGPTNPPPCPGDSVSKVRFDVKSSDDPPKGNLFGGAAHGACNPIYGPDTKLDFGMVFNWKGAQPFNGYSELEIVHSLGRPHFYQKVELTDVTNKLVRVAFQPKFSLPGVSEVWCRLVDADGNLIWVNRYRMAYDWQHYKPAIQVQSDFKAFWDQTLADLRALPLEPEVARVYEDHPTFELYDVTFNGLEKKRIHAMLFVPKGLKLPAAATVTGHPGTTGFGVNKRPDGVYGSAFKHSTNLVTIVPLIRGHAPDAPDIPFNHPWWGPLDNRDTYVARAWYCAMVRAVDYLATRPDLVDMSRVMAAGGSQGGGLALVTAGLDPRIRVCIADCPANCQPAEIMEHYASFGPSKGQVPAGKTVQDVEALLSYYNPVNFCPSIRCPTYVGSNIGDLTVHSMGPLAAYHNLTGLKPEQKDFYPGFTHFHGSGPGLGVKKKEWINQLTDPAAP